MNSPPLRPIRVIGQVDKTGNVIPTMQFIRWLEDMQFTVDINLGNGFGLPPLAPQVALVDVAGFSDSGPVAAAVAAQTDIAPVDSGCCDTAGLEPV